MVQTVTGPISPDDLGRTLMHEHLTVGWPGSESHTTAAQRPRADVVAVCVDRISELQDLGYSTLLDPCPNDLGRDVSLLVEVAEATGFNIICATGLYKEEEGGTAYWRFKGQFEDVGPVMADLFIAELIEGMIARFKTELNPEAPGDVTVVATGGLAKLMAEQIDSFDHVNPDLTLIGLRFVHEMNNT